MRSICSKIKRAVTDSTTGISFDPELRPAVSNLVSILAAASGREPHDVRARVPPVSLAHVARTGGG
jgi:tryptophanyl-tRNA synthetase